MWGIGGAEIRIVKPRKFIIVIESSSFKSDTVDGEGGQYGKKKLVSLNRQDKI